jgi:hypoxanthine phosphoribosyltransferase
MINYVSYAQLCQDVIDFARTKLPTDIQAVCGVPRSGMLVATILANELHVPLFVPGAGRLAGYRIVKQHITPAQTKKAPPKRWLLIDDSVNTGGSLRNYQGELNPTYTAAMYVSPEGKGSVDFHFSVVPKPRLFEWNLYSAHILGESILDMDGILCYDSPVPETQQSVKNYSRWLLTAPLLHKPTRTVNAICTSRLERYRKITRRWLAFQRIAYKGLSMHPALGAEARRRSGDHGKRKADYYVNRETASLFIESNLKQGEQIFKISGKPVLVPTAGVLFQNK